MAERSGTKRKVESMNYRTLALDPVEFRHDANSNSLVKGAACQQSFLGGQR